MASLLNVVLTVDTEAALSPCRLSSSPTCPQSCHQPHLSKELRGTMPSGTPYNRPADLGPCDLRSNCEPWSSPWPSSSLTFCSPRSSSACPGTHQEPYPFTPLVTGPLSMNPTVDPEVAPWPGSSPTCPQSQRQLSQSGDSAGVGLYWPKPVCKDWKRCLLLQMHRHKCKVTQIMKS